MLVVHLALKRLFCLRINANEPATMQPCYLSSEAHHGKQFYWVCQRYAMTRIILMPCAQGSRDITALACGRVVRL